MTQRDACPRDARDGFRARRCSNLLNPYLLESPTEGLALLSVTSVTVIARSLSALVSRSVAERHAPSSSVTSSDRPLPPVGVLCKASPSCPVIRGGWSAAVRSARWAARGVRVAGARAGASPPARADAGLPSYRVAAAR